MIRSLSRLVWRDGLRGLCLRPYVCPAGYWTIGYGSRWLANGAAVCGRTAPITAAEADNLLLTALRGLQPEIRKLACVSLPVVASASSVAKGIRPSGF
nr:hypothetical protein [Acetobacter persici]